MSLGKAAVGKPSESTPHTTCSQLRSSSATSDHSGEKHPAVVRGRKSLDCSVRSNSSYPSSNALVPSSKNAPNSDARSPVRSVLASFVAFLFRHPFGPIRTTSKTKRREDERTPIGQSHVADTSMTPSGGSTEQNCASSSHQFPSLDLHVENTVKKTLSLWENLLLKGRHRFRGLLVGLP